MPISLRPVALAALVLLAPAATLAQVVTVPPVPPPPRAIRVSGEGKVYVAPDVARLLVGAVTTGRDLGKVTQDAAAVLQRVMAELSKAGVAPRDVRTVRHDVQVERPWNSSTGRAGAISGYTVTDQVQVTVRDLGRLGAVLDQVSRAGGNTIDQLSMEKEELGPDRARALALAYAAARTKAEAIARAAGVALGEVIDVEEGFGQRGPIPLMANRVALAESAPATPVAAGDLEVTGSVTVYPEMGPALPVLEFQGRSTWTSCRTVRMSLGAMPTFDSSAITRRATAAASWVTLPRSLPVVTAPTSTRATSGAT